MRQDITTYILCAFFVLFAVMVKANTYLNLDSAWLADSALKLVSGEDLYTDFVETNPPFIVYLCALPIWLGAKVGLGLAASYKVFTFAVLALSVVMSLKYLKSNFLKIIIFLCLFLLPGHSFGQREHLFLALMLPYFLSILNEQRPNLAEVILALVAFLIKPYFVLFFIGFALWQVLVLKRSLWLKENFIIGFGIALYLCFIYIFERDYLTNVLPLLIKYYDGFYHSRLAFFIKGLVVLMLVISLRIISPFVKKDEQDFLQKDISFVMFAASISGFTLILQDKGWDNHFMPFYFFIVLAVAMLVERAPKNVLYFMALVLLAVYAHIFGSALTGLVHPRAQQEKQEVIDYMNKYAAGGEVLNLGADLNNIYPELIYSKASFNWDYPHLWMIFDLYKDEPVLLDAQGKAQINFHAPEKQNKDEAAIFQSMVNYVVNEKPAMIITKNTPFRTEKGLIEFNLIEYFIQSPKFREAFANYRFIKQVGVRRIYVLDHEEAATNIPKQR